MADPKANDKQGYHQFISETSVVRNDGEGGSDYMTAETHEYGSFEVFWSDGAVAMEPDWRLEVANKDTKLGFEEWVEHQVDAGNPAPTEPGWYWWACFPGCMPDGEPSGPFATSQEAYDDAQEGA